MNGFEKNMKYYDVFWKKMIVFWIFLYYNVYIDRKLNEHTLNIKCAYAESAMNKEGDKSC